MKCKSCTHYGFYKMITGGPYGYAGEIPCVTCWRFLHQDNYEPAEVDRLADDGKWREADHE